MQIFEEVKKNKPFIMNVYKCVHREQVEKYLQPLVNNLVLNVINEEAQNTNVTEDDKLFISQIYSYILMGLMLDWIKDDMEPDPEEIVDRLATLIKDTIPEALKRFKV